MNLTFRDLEYFLTLAAVGHMGRAAEVHGVTQPALSKSLRRLESETGLVLFDRATRRITLNAAGQLFLQHAKRLYSDYQEAVLQTGALQAGQAGALRVGTTGSLVNLLVTPALAEMAPRRPAMKATVTVGLAESLLDSVSAGSIDLAIVPVFGPISPHLSSRTLSRDQLRVIVRRAHPLASNGSVGLARLIDYPWVLPLPSAWLRNRLSLYFDEHGLPAPRAAMELPYLSPETLEALTGTDLIILCPDSLAKASQNRQFVPLPVDIKFGREVCLITRRNCNNTPLMQEFEQLLATNAHSGGTGYGNPPAASGSHAAE